MSRFWIFFVQHFRFTYLILGLIILLGLVSVAIMPKESDPEVTIPVGIVLTAYPGASAIDVEELVTNEIEQEIESLEDLDGYSSSSSEGLSSITVEFDADADVDDRMRALKDAVDDAQPDLPDEVESSYVKQISITDTPILSMSMTADVSKPELKKMAELFQDEAEKIKGISEVNVSGTQDREIQVIADQSKLDQFGISLISVLRAIQAQDVQLPLGTIEQNQKKYSVRFEASLKETELIPDIPVGTKEGQPILLRDVAIVTDGLQEETTISRLSQDGKEANSAVGIEIFKKDGADILKLVDEVQAKIEEMQEGKLTGTEFVVTFDLGQYIRNDLGNLLWSGFQTIALVFLVLYFFLGRREAILAGMSIPITFMMTFIGLSFLGYTINFLTLFSLVLSLGILVDATIVIVEGMYMNINIGKSAKEAAKNTIREFHSPVTSGILTTVSAFVPMMFASGIMGQFIRTIPVTVIIVLLSSLFVGLAITPIIGSRLIKKSFEIKKGETHYSQVGFIQKLGEWYESKLRALLKDRKQQRKLMMTLVVLFFLSFSLIRCVAFTPALSPSSIRAISLTCSSKAHWVSDKWVPIRATAGKLSWWSLITPHGHSVITSLFGIGLTIRW